LLFTKYNKLGNTSRYSSVSFCVVACHVGVVWCAGKDAKCQFGNRCQNRTCRHGNDSRFVELKPVDTGKIASKNSTWPIIKKNERLPGKRDECDRHILAIPFEKTRRVKCDAAFFYLPDRIMQPPRQSCGCGLLLLHESAMREVHGRCVSCLGFCSLVGRLRE
jgi:hypothetical protein